MSDNPNRWRLVNSTAFWRIIIVAAIILPLLGICYLGYAIYHGISVSFEAEDTLHATIITIDVVHQYVRDSRRWPPSWEALEDISVPDWAMYSWPRDVKEIRKRVRVEFGVTTKELAQLKADECDAIKPIGPHYESYRGGIASLLKTIREIEKLH